MHHLRKAVTAVLLVPITLLGSMNYANAQVRFKNVPMRFQ